MPAVLRLAHTKSGPAGGAGTWCASSWRSLVALFWPPSRGRGGPTAPTRGRLGRVLDVPKLLAGRLPLPGSPAEIALDQNSAAALHLHVGSILPMVAAPLGAGGPAKHPAGLRRLSERVVGVFVTRASVEPVTDFDKVPFVLASPALIRELGPRYIAFHGANVKLRPGTTPGGFGPTRRAWLCRARAAHRRVRAAPAARFRDPEGARAAAAAGKFHHRLAGHDTDPDSAAGGSPAGGSGRALGVGPVRPRPGRPRGRHHSSATCAADGADSDHHRERRGLVAGARRGAAEPGAGPAHGVTAAARARYVGTARQRHRQPVRQARKRRNTRDTGRFAIKLAGRGDDLQVSRLMTKVECCADDGPTV